MSEHFVLEEMVPAEKYPGRSILTIVLCDFNIIQTLFFILWINSHFVLNGAQQGF